MICQNCGDVIPDGVKFCNRCGAEQEVVETPPQSAEMPGSTDTYRAAPYTAAAGGANTRLLLAITAVVALLGIMSVVCSSLVIKGGEAATSIPFMSVTALLGNLSRAADSASGMGGILGLDLGDWGASLAGPLAGMIVYTVFAVICIVLYTISAVLVLKKNPVGIVMGMAAGALTILLSVIMIIAMLVANANLDIPNISLAPSVWVLLAIPVGALYALLCAVKNRELLS